MLRPVAPGRRRRASLSASAEIDWSWFARDRPLASPGDRRELVAPFLEPPALELEGANAWLTFALPPGSYATEVLAQSGIIGRVP